MQVKSLICETLQLVGRTDAAEAIQGGSTLLTEVSRLKRACLTYLNAVIDELTRGYFPLYFTETLTRDGEEDGCFAYVTFTYTPLEIKKVTSQGEEIKWSANASGIVAEPAEITVEYAYTFSVGDGETFDYPHRAVGSKLIEYGMAAEYFLVLGDAVSSAAWESRYRNEIENLLAFCAANQKQDEEPQKDAEEGEKPEKPVGTVKGRIPPRRWI